MRLMLRQIQGLECRVCRQLFNTERRTEDAQKTWLFGFVNYGVCPCCGQQVHSPANRDSNYRRRYRRFVLRKRRA